MGLPKFVCRKLDSAGRPRCPFCPKHFASWQQFRAHLPEHCGPYRPAGGRPECPACKQDFRQEYQVLLHLVKLQEQGLMSEHLVPSVTARVFEEKS